MPRPAAALAALSILIAGPVAAAAPAPQVVDAQGDANGLTTPYPYGGLVGDVMNQLLPSDPFGPGTPTEPASWGPGDLLSVRFETTYVSVPVGEDGLDHRATGVRLHVRTAQTPTSAGPTTTYVTRARFAANSEAPCVVFFEAVFGGGAPSTTPSTQARLQIGNGHPECPLGTVSYAAPAFGIATTSAPAGVTLTYPLEAMDTYLVAPLFAEGAAIEAPQAFVAVGTFAPRIDTAPVGQSFTVGQDMPADVPCTRGCP